MTGTNSMAERERTQGARLYRSLDVGPPERDVVLTVGSFDGVHRGHQYLLTRLVAHARATDRLSAALTFYPHPRVVLHPEQGTQYLMPRARREEYLGELGVDLVVVLPFTRETAAVTAGEFAERLHRRLRMRELWVGPDFRMGRGREGTTERLAELGREIGYDLRLVEPLMDRGAPVSSTRIRGLLAEGDVCEAARLLGHPVTFEGHVVAGAHRGKELGFPTANIPLDPTLAVPLDGVYAVWTRLGGRNGRALPGVANVGSSPSFASEARLLEVHLIDYRGSDLYGERLVVEFARRLRPVLRFPDRGSLVQQIAADVVATQELLTGAPCRA